MLDVKKQSWLAVCGFIAGFASRKLYERIYLFQNIGETSFLDLDSIVYGVTFMLIIGLTITSIGYYQRYSDIMLRRKRRISTKGKNMYLGKISMALYGYGLYQRKTVLFSVALFSILFVISDNAILSALPLIFLPVFGQIMADDKSTNSPQIDKAFHFFGIETVQGSIAIVLTFIAIIPGAYALSHVSQTFGGGKPEWITIRLNQKAIDDTATHRKYDNRRILLLYRQGNTFWFKISGDSTKIAFRRDQIDYFQSEYKHEM